MRGHGQGGKWKTKIWWVACKPSEEISGREGDQLCQIRGQVRQGQINDYLR